MLPQIEIMPWEEVAFSATFLRSLGGPSWKAELRGLIISKNDDPLYLVWWRGDAELRYVNKYNIIPTLRNGGLQADAERCRIYGLNESTKRPLDSP